MEGFIIKFGNAITSALGLSSEAVGIIMVIGLAWFYHFKWKPFSDMLDAHVQNEIDANGSYAERAAERDRITNKLQDSLAKIDSMLDTNGTGITNVEHALNSSSREQAKMISDIDSMRMELIKISTQLSMSPNARSLT